MAHARRTLEKQLDSNSGLAVAGAIHRDPSRVPSKSLCPSLFLSQGVGAGKAPRPIGPPFVMGLSGVQGTLYVSVSLSLSLSLALSVPLSFLLLLRLLLHLSGSRNA